MTRRERSYLYSALPGAGSERSTRSGPPLGRGESEAPLPLASLPVPMPTPTPGASFAGGGVAAGSAGSGELFIASSACTFCVSSSSSREAAGLLLLALTRCGAECTGEAVAAGDLVYGSAGAASTGSGSGSGSGCGAAFFLLPRTPKSRRVGAS